MLSSAESNKLARRVLEGVPSVMRRIRAEMREASGPGLTVPQFRILAYLFRHSGAPTGELARHQGVSMPAMSRMTESLRRRGLIQRTGDTADRRRGHLSLSPAGLRTFERARTRAAARLVGSFSTLTPEEGRALERGLELLGRVM